MENEILYKLYQTCTGKEPENITALPASGSHRHYFRLTGLSSLIGVQGESADENRAFLYLARHFREKGLPVPQVIGSTADHMYYLQEDLGKESLFDAIGHGRTQGEFSAEEQALLHRTFALLPDFQWKGAEGLDFSQCYPQAAFNERCILWDLNYFKYCFLKACGVDFQEDRLEDDFQRMTQVLLADADENTFMYRDFQSRNIMIRNGQPWFIDFQGGRRGPVYYDVASFLWQAKANYPENLRNALLQTYLTSLRRYRPVDEQAFLQRLRHFVLFRTLQVLGAYGFRGYFERKAHFLQSIPFAIGNLEQLLRTPLPEYPYLNEILSALVEKQRSQQSLQPATPPYSGLTVDITSFSYRKGIPEDLSGNGGGFVFDCRAIHNPGRYEAYKALTGMDEPVIRFLEEDGEILTFLQHVYALADASVSRYLKRGFTHLCISFGCTGGQHRSVYAAQRLAEHLHQTFGVRIILTHREQNKALVWKEAQQ